MKFIIKQADFENDKHRIRFICKGKDLDLYVSLNISEYNLITDGCIIGVIARERQ